MSRRSDLHDLRNEHRQNLRGGNLADIGVSCANCGSTDHVQYHHIVPLCLGGTNAITNIVPLCSKCHRAVHTGRPIQAFADHSSDAGRPPKCNDEDAFHALDLLLDGQIGNRKCKKLMGLSARTEPVNTSQYKRWSSARGIAKVKNTIDVAATISPFSLMEGKVVGWYELSDGERHDITFHDTGINDVVYRYARIEDQPEMTLYELRSSRYAPSSFRKRYGDKIVRNTSGRISPEWWNERRKDFAREASAM